MIQKVQIIEEYLHGSIDRAHLPASIPGVSAVFGLSIPHLLQGLSISMG
jgi:hypothetical protein